MFFFFIKFRKWSLLVSICVIFISSAWNFLLQSTLSFITEIHIISVSLLLNMAFWPEWYVVESAFTENHILLSNWIYFLSLSRGYCFILPPLIVVCPQTVWEDTSLLWGNSFFLLLLSSCMRGYIHTLHMHTLSTSSPLLQYRNK